MPVLVLLRHGEKSLEPGKPFTAGPTWTSRKRGGAEASRAGRLLAQAACRWPWVIPRCSNGPIRTLLAGPGRHGRLWLPYGVSWRLNERHYGALHGLDKAETAERYGKVQVQNLAAQLRHPAAGPGPGRPPATRAATPAMLASGREDLPGAESLKNTLQRLMPFWQRELGPPWSASRGCWWRPTATPCGRSSSTSRTCPIPKSPGWRFPTGNPLVLELSRELAVRKASYLDPKRAAPLPGRG